MNLHKISTLVLGVIVLIVLDGCSRNGAYRSDLSVCQPTSQNSCTTNAVIHHEPGQENEFYLGFVEFDDQGQMWKRGQMEKVFTEFYDIAAKEDVLAVAFVHGWHHNAAPDDDNVHSFEKLLGRIAQTERQESRASHRKSRKVLGLYIGWRGESIEIPVINDLTFWERKNTAENVGLMGVTEVLLKLEEIINIKAGMETAVPKPQNSRMVVIGHSFGGAVVFTALQQALADRFIDSRRGKTFRSDAQGFGDLVILVNPAFEAMRYATLYDISQQSCRNYFPTQLPKLVILTSEGDYATRYAFPFGRFFSTFFETHTTLTRHYCDNNHEVMMEIAEGEADRNTIGHFKPYQTHYLAAASDVPQRQKDFRFAELKTVWSAQQPGKTLSFKGSRLIHLNHTHPLNPYLNIKVDSDLIGDHNDIWGDEVVSFLRDLIVISTLPEEGGSGAHKRD